MKLPVRVPSLAAGAALALSAAPVGAGDLFVGPDEAHPTIQEAIAAASPGDRIFVSPGFHSAFDLSKAVEIRGAGPSLTRVTGFGPGLHSRVSNVPAGTVATIAGIGFVYTEPSAFNHVPLLEVEDNPGTVVLQDVEMNVLSFGPLLSPALVAADTDRLLLQGCEIVGADGYWEWGGKGFAAIDAAAVSLSVSDSALAGGDFVAAEFSGGDEGAPAIRLVGGELRLARVVAAGGLGGYDSFDGSTHPGGPAVDALGSTVVVSGGPGNHLQGGLGAEHAGDAAPGGPALRATEGSVARVAADAWLQGGLDGSGTSEADPISVGPGSSVTLLGVNLPTLGVDPGEADPGSTVSLELSGEPGALALPLFSLGLGPALEIDGVEGVLHLDTAAWFPLAAVPLDSQGLAASSGLVPSSPALAGAHLWLQAAEGAGGVVRLSNAARLSIAL